MGKKKKHGRNRKTKNHPDEVRYFGPIGMARFGSSVVSKNMLSAADYEQYMSELAADYPNTIEAINKLVAEIVSTIVVYKPLSLLCRAAWNLAASQLDRKLVTDAEAKALRVIEYAQSVIVSTTPAGIQLDIDEAGFAKIDRLVTDLYNMLTFSYGIAHTAHEKQVNPDYDENYDQLVRSLELHWLLVRGDRHQVHEIVRLNELLLPHDTVLRELFGITSVEFVAGVEGLLHSLTFGYGEVFVDMHQMHKEWCAEVERSLRSHPTQQFDPTHVFENDTSWNQRRDSIAGRLSAGDLFDLAKVSTLPSKLVEQLAYSPGEEDEFFSEGPFKGWPQRVLPSWRRPFIRIDDRIYCFDVHSLMDNLYRVIQRLVIRLQPDYREQWNIKQKEVSETLPLEYLNKMLPRGARTYRNVFYDAHEAGSGKPVRCETDAVIIVDDSLFVVEVKAGAFVRTPPATDFDAYKNSLRDLVQKPTNQALRFVNALESAGSLDLTDQSGAPIIQIESKNFASVVPTVITLDAFTHLTAKAQHLGPAGVTVGQRPIWILGLDELRILADVLCLPFQLQHYLVERQEATMSAAVELEDEQMHLGLYLEHKRYVEQLEQYRGVSKITPIGFDSKIDEYYRARLETPGSARPPQPTSPSRIMEILQVLHSRELPLRRKVALLFHDMPRPILESINSEIEKALVYQATERKGRPVSLSGGPSITIVCSQDGLLKHEPQQARDYALASILIDQDRPRMLLELEYSVSGSLYDLRANFFTRADVVHAEVPRLSALSDYIREQRVYNRAAPGRLPLGRNDRCPCGSGKKAKKCHFR